MPSWPKKILIYTDGASRGNPGPSAIGIYITDSEKKVVYELGEQLEGNQTNNFAEYMAVIRALKLAIENQVEEISLFSDSEFLIRQLEGRYKVKSSNIAPLFKEAKELLKKIPSYTLKHIKREFNQEADGLARKILDEFCL